MPQGVYIVSYGGGQRTSGPLATAGDEYCHAAFLHYAKPASEKEALPLSSFKASRLMSAEARASGKPPRASVSTSVNEER